METGLAGIDGLEMTRSISRNGFSQVTAIFEEGTDIYFARQQVNERLTPITASLPEGAEPVMGPISTGLGEVLMYTIEFEHPGARKHRRAMRSVGSPTEASLPNAVTGSIAMSLRLLICVPFRTGWSLHSCGRSMASPVSIPSGVSESNISYSPILLA